ncbi:hypothetical protein [Mycobacteroides abscessus]|uniref:hypothetical protein n=1 Tax=Mycobacteroides abscessus TaxID=36809 RepID=UPI0009291872|nr:hypothetical protein [Mycobacteroides abscessus]SIC60207.1 Uncharacterised protein [Mycobacteroides abscessus subsp. abscessus]
MADIYGDWARSQGIQIDQPKKQAAQTKTKDSGGLASWLPTIGGTLGALGAGAGAGALAGSVLPGAGTLAGAGVGLIAALLGGAGGSALGKVGENAIEGEQDLGKGVGEEALIGGVTSLPVGAGLKLARAGVKASTGIGKKSVEQLVSEAGQSALPRRVAGKGVTQTVETASPTVSKPGLLNTFRGDVDTKAAANFLGLTPTQAQRLADEGIDQVALGRRAAKYGNTADEIIGGTGKGGRLQDDISRYEGIIDDAAKQADISGIRINGDNLVKALQDERAKLANKLGAGDQVKAIDKIIKQAQTKYKNGVSYSEARQILKDANGKFGSSILDDSGNAVARDAQKLEGNTMRRELKTASPTIADALDNEAQLIQARELMSRKRGADLAQKGTALSRVDLARPGSLIEPIVRSDKVTSRVLRAGGSNAAPQAATGPTGQTLLGALTRQGLGRAGAGALGVTGDQSQQFDQAAQDAGIDPTAALGSMDLGGMATEPSNPFGVSLDEVGAQMMQALANGDSKGYGVLSDLYDRINDYENAAGGGSGKPMGVEAQKITNNASSGLSSLNDLESMIDDDPGIVARASLPDVSLLNSLTGTSGYRAAIKNVQDAMSRLRSGASMTEQEAARFDQMLPRLGDDAATVKYKIQQFRNYFGNAVGNASGSSATTLQDLIANQ